MYTLMHVSVSKHHLRDEKSCLIWLVLYIYGSMKRDPKWGSMTKKKEEARNKARKESKIN